MNCWPAFLLVKLYMLHLITIGFVVARSPTDLHCGAGCAQASPPLSNLAVPVDPAWLPLPLGTIAPRGWLLEQLLLQANALSGFIPTSTFPGALTVNQSAWTGSTTSFSGTSQWLPYWSNGNVPLLLLLRAAGPAALARLDPSAKLEAVIDGMMTYVLSHTNRSGHGWIGPYLNEPGDVNGHGLWDPLNMLRSLMMYAEATPSVRRAVAAAVVAHLTSEAALLVSDPVYKWASTRWPTFVQVCLYVVDHYVAEFGADRAVMPLGTRRTAEMLMDAARRFRAKGMDWLAYYNRTGPVKFPTRGSVSGWNTHDHGVNNGEGALAWPAIDQRLGAADVPPRWRWCYICSTLTRGSQMRSFVRMRSFVAVRRIAARRPALWWRLWRHWSRPLPYWVSQTWRIGPSHSRSTPSPRR